MQAKLYASDNASFVPKTLFKHQFLCSVDQPCYPCVMQEGSSSLDLHMVRAGHGKGHTWDSQDYFLQKPHATYASDSRITSGIQLQCMKQVDQNKGVSVKSNGTSSNGVFFKNVYPWMRETQSASSSHDTPNCCQSGLNFYFIYFYLLRNRCF